MSPLGLQMTTLGSLGGPGMLGDPGRVALRADLLWECDGGHGSNLQPTYNNKGTM